MGKYMEKIKSFIQKLFQFPVPLKTVYSPYWILAFVVLVSVDLASKKLITENLNFYLSHHQAENITPSPGLKALYDSNDRYNILGEDGNLIKFRLIFNDRFVFGSGPSAPVAGFFLTFFAIIFLFFYRWHNFNLGHPISWLFVFSGAMGNLIDKMFIKSLTTREWVLSIFPQPGHINGVVDFVECIWFGWSSAGDIPFMGFLAWETWPSFNIADSLIVVGITLMLFTMNPVLEKEKTEA